MVTQCTMDTCNATYIRTPVPHMYAGYYVNAGTVMQPCHFT